MPTEELVPANDLPTDDKLVPASDMPSLSEIARQRLLGGMGAEKIGKTSGPGVLGALKDSYLGQAGDRLTQNYNRAVSGVKQFASNPIEDLAQTVAHPATDSGLTNAIAGALGAVTSGFAPLGAGAAELTRGAGEIAGQSPESARQMGNRAAQASEMIAGGVPLLKAPAAPGEEYVAQNPVADEGGGRLQQTAERMYKSALKPSSTITPDKTAKMVQAGLQEGIPVSRGGLEKLSGLVDDLNSQIAARIDAAGPKRQISPGRAVEYTRELEPKFANQVNPEGDLAAIDASRDEFLRQLQPEGGGAVRNMTASEAQAMKQGTYRSLGSKAYGELKTATIETQKALARGLKDELAAQFPELSSLNARESSLLSLEPALTKRVQAVSNHQIVGIGTPIAATAAKAVTGSGGVGAVAGFMKAVFDNPGIKSRLAIALNKASGGGQMAAARAKVGAYVSALEDASTPDNVTPIAAGRPSDIRMKILNDMANAARSREDQQTADRLSALANR